MNDQAKNQQRVFIVMPIYNESEVVLPVINKLKTYGYSIVAVDDGSSDETFKVLEDIPEIHTLRHIINLGQGAALQTGITYALKCGAKYIVTFDSDGQHPASEIKKFIEILEEGNVDVVLGSRFLSDDSCENVPKSKRIILRLATYFTRISSGIKVTDTHNGFRAFTSDAASRLNITQNRMSHASQILSQISKNHIKFSELPVSIAYTSYSMAKGQKISNSLNILWDSLFSK